MRYLHFHDFVYKNGICHQSLALLKKYNMFFILFRYKHELVKNKKKYIFKYKMPPFTKRKAMFYILKDGKLEGKMP